MKTPDALNPKDEVANHSSNDFSKHNDATKRNHTVKYTMKYPPIFNCFLALAFLAAAALPASAATITWDGGSANALWSVGANWDAPEVPPASGDTAVFNAAAGAGGAIIDLGTAQTVDAIQFNSAAVAGYTIGAGAVGTDTLTFSNSQAGGDNISMNATAAANQTINANLVTEDATTADIGIVNRSGSTLTINGNFDTGSTGTAGVTRLEFGQLGSSASTGTIDMNGSISNTGGATRIDLLVGGGTTLNLNGAVAADGGNTMRTILLDDTTVNVNDTGGILGQGQLDVRYGTVNFNNTTNNQVLSNSINFGSGTQGNGDSTVTIASGVQVNLASGINYFADSITANSSFLSGDGTLQITGNNRTFNIADHPAIAGPELTISTDITSDTSNRTITKLGAGTVRLSGSTISSGSFSVQNGTLQLQTDGAVNSTVRDLTLQVQNTGATTVDPVFDLNGADATLDDLFLGHVASNLSGGGQGVSVINSDPGSGGTFTIDDIVYREGTTVELPFDNEVGTDFGANQQVTGMTSGATGFIVGASRAGTTGVFSLQNVVGTFQDNETLTVTGTGTGTPVMANGTNTAVSKLNGGATVSANLNIASASTWTVDDGADTVDLLVSGDISDDNNTRDITIIGAGTVQLDGSNTHDRTLLQNALTIAGSGDIFGPGDTGLAGAGATGTNAAANQEGRVTLQQRNVAGVSAAGDLLYNGAVTLDINGQDVVFHESIVLGGSTSNFAGGDTIENIQIVDNAGGGKLILGGLNGTNDNNNITYAAGTANVNKTATISADIEMANSGSTFTVNNGADDVDLEVSGDILSDNAGGRSLSKNGAGTLLLSGTNDNSGAAGGIDVLFINAGTLRISSDANLGDNDVLLGNNTTDGTLEYTGTGETINNQFRIGDNNGTVGTRTGGGVILNNGSGTLTLSSGAFNQTRPDAMTNRTLTFGGTSDIDVTGAIIDNAATVATIGVTKDGANTVSLNGNNTYTGATAVNAGTLNVTGTNTSAITIASGATIGGEGSTTGGLTFAAGATTLEIDSTTAAALSSSGLTTTGSTVTVNAAGSGPAPITVIDYSTGAGTYTGTVGTDFALGTATTSARASAGTFADTTTAITLDLGFVSNTWVGGVDSNWDIETTTVPSTGTANWSNTSDAYYYDGDTANFDDTATSFTPTLQASVAPDGINFTANTNAYTVSSAAAETITVGPGGLNFLGNAATADVTINSELIGSGTITKGVTAGAVANVGQTILTADNSSFTGVTVIETGDLQINDVNALGNDPSNTVTIKKANDDDGRLLINDQGTFANDIVVSNVGTNKRIRFDNGGDTAARALTMSGTITMEENNNTLVLETEGQREAGDIGGSTSGNVALNTHVLTVDGLITSAVASSDGPITKTDQGTLILANAANDFTGRLEINSGTVYVASIGNIGEASHAGASRGANPYDIRLGAGGAGAALGQSGTLIYTGAGAESTDRQLRIGGSGGTQAAPGSTGGGTIANNGGGALTFTNAIFNTPENTTADRISARTLTLAGTYAGVNEIQGVIQDNLAVVTDDETVGITVDTDGTWQLSGASTYTGATDVDAGTLRVNGSTAAGSDVSVASGATLGGTGTVGGGTILIGTLDVGTDAGTAGQMDFGGDLSFSDTSEVIWDLNEDTTGGGAGVNFDVITVAGDLNLSATTTLNLDFDGTGGQGDVDWTDLFWSMNQQWTIFEVLGTTTGILDFSIFNENWLDSAGNDFNTSVAGSSPGFSLALDGNDVVIEFMIPEPSRALLLVVGVMGALIRRNRRSRLNI